MNHIYKSYVIIGTLYSVLYNHYSIIIITLYINIIELN